MGIIDPKLEVKRPFQLMLHNTNKTGAQCLDGSPAGLYFSKGHGEGRNRTVFYLLGGGWCSGLTQLDILHDCYERSFTKLGSTANWTDTITSIDHVYSGDKSEDVVYYNWNRVFVIYCDGSGHQGYIDKPFNLNGKDLYFKGSNNTLTSLSWILSKHQTLDTFVLYGFSAGGLAVFTWIETFKQLLSAKYPSGLNFRGFSDSGFFVSYKS